MNRWIPRVFPQPVQGKRDFVTESSQELINERAVVIQRGDELSEFVGLLNELAVSVDVHRNGLPTPNELEGAAIAVVPGLALTESGTPNLALWPRTIAVVDDASKTLVSHINRLGVAMVIRRPIHPRTLRLLLLHEIYRGPERRNRKRTLVGHPIRVGSGLFKQRATLLDISPGGARIELQNAPKIGSKLRILIGKDLTLGKPLKLDAKVVRSIRASGQNGRAEGEIGVALLNAKREAKNIRAILDRFARGPASWNGRIEATDTPPNPTPIPAAGNVEVAPSAEASEESTSSRRLPPSRPVPPPAARSLPPAAATRVPEPVLAPETGATEAPAEEQPEIEFEERRDSVVGSVKTSDRPTVDSTSSSAPTPLPGPESPSERRSDPRIPYDRRVVALGEEAARVLVGRDLSQGGMRIAKLESVEIGDVLRVALHSGDEMEPLVVLANAARHDGEDGTVLTFQDLSEGQQGRLEKIIASSSPFHGSTEEADERDPNGESIVFGEMLETLERGGQPVEQGADPAEVDFDIDAHLDSVFDTSEAVEDAR